MEICGKYALVTGGAEGIGKLLAENLLKRGAQVHITAIHTFLLFDAFALCLYMFVIENYSFTKTAFLADPTRVNEAL